MIKVESITNSGFTSNYRNEGPIGSGAFGTVSKVMHGVSKKYFAAKFIPLNPDYQIYIEREISLLQSLKHPNIIKIEDDVYI